jgi:hypothetical protein
MKKKNEYFLYTFYFILLGFFNFPWAQLFTKKSYSDQNKCYQQGNKEKAQPTKFNMYSRIEQVARFQHCIVQLPYVISNQITFFTTKWTLNCGKPL